MTWAASGGPGRSVVQRPALASVLVALTLASLTAPASAAPVEADVVLTGPEGAPLTADNARDAVLHVGVRRDADGNGTAESNVTLVDADLAQVEPGASYAAMIDAYFYRADGNETDPNPSDPSSITSVERARVVLLIETDGEPDDGGDQSASAATPAPGGR